MFILFSASWVIMNSAASFYFSSTPQKEGEAAVMQGVKYATRTHCGSIAMSSFIFVFIDIINTFLETVQSNSKNPCLCIIYLILVCIIKCLQKVIEYITMQSFAFQAISGDKLMQSCWNGFILSLKHFMKFIFAKVIAQGFIKLGTFVVSGLTTYVMYLIFKIPEFMLFVFLLAELIAYLFMSAIEDSVNGILMSYAVDCELNENNPKFGSPYFHEKL